MSELLNFLSSLLNAIVRVALWLLAAMLALFLLGLALLLVLLGTLWSLLRGKRPNKPLVMGQWQRYASDRVWRGAMGGHHRNGAPPTEVVDVEVREVADTPNALPPGKPRD